MTPSEFLELVRLCMSTGGDDLSDDHFQMIMELAVDHLEGLHADLVRRRCNVVPLRG
jgi:hypothetical protein